MTKEQLYVKWLMTPDLKSDIEAVIATEIAKAQEAKLKPTDQVTDQVTDHKQPEKQNKMVQEKQLRELFKYIEANWDVCVSQIDKTDIKRIFGGVLCEDIMNDTLHEVKAEPEEPKGNCTTFDMSRLVDQEQLSKPFDKERFEAMFRAVVASGRTERWEQDFKFTEEALAKLDAYYATKNN